MEGTITVVVYESEISVIRKDQMKDKKEEWK